MHAGPDSPEGKKELIGFQTGMRESAQSWKELLVDLKDPEFRREVQHPSTLSLLDFSFPRSRLRISKCSGRWRKGKENPIFPW